MKTKSYERLDQEALNYLPIRRKRSHKGTYGKVLCIAGSQDMAGAAYLCAYAAYRVGAGLVRILTPRENRVILQNLIPEAVLTTFDPMNLDICLFEDALDWADAAAIGPGLGREGWAETLTKLALSSFHRPLAVDADGLNHLARSPHLLREHEGDVIVTPHVGEFSRLSRIPVPDIVDRIPELAADFAWKNRCVCVLKDAPSAVGAPDGRCWVNTTGNNGMSTGGSGDVLTGIIAGLLGQKAPALEAALLGVWLHGRAGDLAAETEGIYGLMARHLIQYLPMAMNDTGKGACKNYETLSAGMRGN